MSSPALVSPSSGRGSLPDGDRNTAVCPVGFPLPWQRQRRGHSLSQSRDHMIDYGRVVASGRNADLVAADGPYAQLIATQQRHA